jgi:hypothetical protein
LIEKKNAEKFHFSRGQKERKFEAKKSHGATVHRFGACRPFHHFQFFSQVSVLSVDCVMDLESETTRIDQTFRRQKQGSMRT